MSVDSRPINLADELKKILLFFVFSFAIFFVVFNLAGFFGFLGKQLTLLTPEVSSPTSGVAADVFSPTSGVFTGKENSLEIPKLGIEAPLLWGSSEVVSELTRDLRKGAVIYPTSDRPGEPGQLLVLGHSAPPGWPKIRYEWVFSKIHELKPGDEVVVNFENRQYRYEVTKKIFLEKGEEIPPTEGGPLSAIYLITCWPPGVNYQRLAVEAVLL